MEENNLENLSVKNRVMRRLNQQQIAAAIVVAGVIIGGAILLKGTTGPLLNNSGDNKAALTTVKATAIGDQLMGDPKAKVTLVVYEDFQCPFCGRFFKESESLIRENYVKKGTVQFIYRDFPFLGEESTRAAEAARCASDQEKFWEYHDYLYSHQSGENGGAFSDTNLKSFAKNLGLNQVIFNKCLDENKYYEAVAVAKNEASLVGVNGTPKGFIIKNKKVVDTIDGAIPYVQIEQKLNAAIQ